MRLTYLESSVKITLKYDVNFGSKNFTYKTYKENSKTSGLNNSLLSLGIRGQIVAQR